MSNLIHGCYSHGCRDWNTRYNFRVHLMKLLRCPYHKLEEYKGHENSRIMNDETEEKGPFLTSYEFLAKKKKKTTSSMEAEPSHGGRSMRSRKVMIFFRSSMIKMKLPVFPYGISVFKLCAGF